MDTASDYKSDISSFFNKKSVFITGGTGFLGGVLLEKLLRSCPGVENVFLLIRKKKGVNKDANNRLSELLSTPLFSKHSKSTLAKVIPVSGDVSLPELGLSSADRNLLLENVGIIFHMAATINFSAPLHVALKVNLGGSRSVLALCKEMANPPVLVYVSTAYCNCTQRDIIAEEVYPSHHSIDELLKLTEMMTKEELEMEKSRILGGHPNTYSFTKLLAENLLMLEKDQVPLAIVRPSIVLGTLKEPIPGWVDNVNSGAFAFIAGAGKGVFRTAFARSDKVADLVPCDQVASLLLAAAWNKSQQNNNGMDVFHFTSGSANPIRWGKYVRLTLASVKKNPCTELVWLPSAKCRHSHFRVAVFVFLFHFLPAVIIDAIAILRGEKNILLSIQRKFYRGMLHAAYFTTHEWKFSTRNTEWLATQLSQQDKLNFSFDITAFSWPQYMDVCALGVRKFFHKEAEDSIPQAQHNLKIWILIDISLRVVAAILVMITLSFLFSGNHLLAAIIGVVLTLVLIWL